MTVVTSIFFMWGFITVLNDVLIPHLKSMFALDYTRTMLVQFTFFGAYFLLSLPSGKVVSLFGYKTSIIVGLLVTGARRAGVLPGRRIAIVCAVPVRAFRARRRHHPAAGGGQSLCQPAWPPRLASSRLNLAQALNSLGTALAPKLGG